MASIFMQGKTIDTLTINLTQLDPFIQSRVMQPRPVVSPNWHKNVETWRDTHFAEGTHWSIYKLIVYLAVLHRWNLGLCMRNPTPSFGFADNTYNRCEWSRNVIGNRHFSRRPYWYLDEQQQPFATDNGRHSPGLIVYPRYIHGACMGVTPVFGQSLLQLWPLSWHWPVWITCPSIRVCLSASHIAQTHLCTLIIETFADQLIPRILLRSKWHIECLQLWLITVPGMFSFLFPLTLFPNLSFVYLVIAIPKWAMPAIGILNL